MSHTENAEGKSKTPKKRIRRTKAEIETLLFDAATKIIEKSGFAGLTVTGIIQQAKVDPPVFYNRYTDIEDFIERYVRNYDYWLRDSIDISVRNTDDPIMNIERILNELIDSLVKNVPMQKLIAWEMSEVNHITKRTAQARDLTAGYIIDYFIVSLKDCAIRFDYSLALFIGGLYYLIIHRDLGTFNYIDFSKEESIIELKKNLNMIIHKVFNDYKTPTDINLNKEKQQMKMVARELILNNVDYDIIKNATKLSDTVLKSLYKDPKK